MTITGCIQQTSTRGELTTDGCEVESGEMASVDVGETFYRSDITWMSDVRLEHDYTWVEIDKETFNEHFEVVDE